MSIQRPLGTHSAIARSWNDWADAHLRDGDVVFMRGDCYVMMGMVDFSGLLTDLTASRFSHLGLVAIENGQAYVYDIRQEGCKRTRFGELLSNRHLHQVAIKRYRDAVQNELVVTADFCRGVFDRQEKFDNQFKLDNGRLYCAELVEIAYRSAGYQLSEPVAIQDLPNYGRHMKSIRFTGAITNVDPSQPVLLPGNEDYGVWSNPNLDLILDLPDTKVHPSSVGPVR